jgi:hypothetical protein
MMSRCPVIAVVGATGAQGGGLARAILADPARSFAVRAITRCADAGAARTLAALGAQVVAADLDDAASLERALQGAYGVFGGLEQARHVAQAARRAAVRHVIWSKLEDVRKDGSQSDTFGAAGRTVPRPADDRAAVLVLVGQPDPFGPGTAARSRWRPRLRAADGNPSTPRVLRRPTSGPVHSASSSAAGNSSGTRSALRGSIWTVHKWQRHSPVRSANRCGTSRGRSRTGSVAGMPATTSIAPSARSPWRASCTQACRASSSGWADRPSPFQCRPLVLARQLGPLRDRARHYPGCSTRDGRINLCSMARGQGLVRIGAAVLAVALFAISGCMTQRSVQGATCEDVGPALTVPTTAEVPEEINVLVIVCRRSLGRLRHRFPERLVGSFAGTAGCGSGRASTLPSASRPARSW